MSSQSSEDAPTRVKNEVFEEEDGLFGDEHDEEAGEEEDEFEASEDDEEEEGGEEPAADRWKDGPFKIKLVAPCTTQEVSAIHLFEQIEKGVIKLDPEYQRDVVWGMDRSSSLIKSLMEGYFVPPVIFNSTTVIENGVERNIKICVDGKQRLSSIVRFIHGLIPVLDAKGGKWYYDHPLMDNGLRKSTSGHIILPTRSLRKFRQSFLICHEFKNLDPTTEEEMFALVQKGMPLTAAEKLKAKSTAWAEFAKQYEVDYELVFRMVYSKSKRAAEFRAILEIFATILEVENPSAVKSKKDQDTIRSDAKPLLKNTRQQLEKLVKDENLLDQKSKADFKRVFDHYERLVLSQCTVVKKSPKFPLGYKLKDNSAFLGAPDYLIGVAKAGRLKTFSPIEFLGVAVLLYVHGETRTDHMLINDIKDMRRYLRERNPLDLRMNTNCWADCWDYIERDMIDRRGGADVVAARNRGERLPRVQDNDVDMEDGSEEEYVAPQPKTVQPKKVQPATNGKSKPAPILRPASSDESSDEPTPARRAKKVQFTPDVVTKRNNTIYAPPTAQMTGNADESCSDDDLPVQKRRAPMNLPQHLKREPVTQDAQNDRPVKRAKTTAVTSSSSEDDSASGGAEVITLDDSEDEESSDQALSAWLSRASKNLPEAPPIKPSTVTGAVRGRNMARRGVPLARGRAGRRVV